MSVSLAELDTAWSIDDLFDANSALDIHEELQRLAHQRARERENNR